MNLINVIDEEQMQENVNADDGARIALEEGLQRDNKIKCIEEEGEADLSQDKEKTIIELKKEEDYAKDLAKGERTFDDLSITKEGFDEDEINMFQVEELVLELKKTRSCQDKHADEGNENQKDTVFEEVKLIVRINQGNEGKLLRVVKEEKEKYVGIDEQHSDVFERNQVQRKLEDKLFLESKYIDIEQRLFGKSREGKDERAVVRIQQLQREDNKQKYEDEWISATTNSKVIISQKINWT